MSLRLRTSALILVCCLLAPASRAASLAPEPVDRDGNPGHPRPAVHTASMSDGVDSVQVFFDQASFLSAAGVVITETFESQSADTLCDGGTQSELTFDDFVATSTPVALRVMREACFGNHNTTQGGRKYLAADTDSASLSAEVTFTFAESLAAFGTFLIDVDDATLQVRVDETDYAVLPGGDGSVAYFGILSPTPFTSVTFRISDGTDSYYSLDDVAHATPGGQPPVAAPEGIQTLGWGRLKAYYHRP